MGRWLLTLLLSQALVCAAHAEPQPCSNPNKLFGVLVTDDPSLRPSEVLIIRLNEVRYDDRSRRLTIWGDKKTKITRLDGRELNFPIAFEFDISDLKTCPLAFAISVIGDKAEKIGEFHFASYGHQTRGYGFTLPGLPSPTAIWITKTKSNF
jgi:hypothetical protein